MNLQHDPIDPGDPDGTDLTEHALPGPARLLELRSTGGGSISILVDPVSGTRRLSAVAPGEDEPMLSVELSVDQAADLESFLRGDLPE